jgi:hypothetical protein
MGLFEHWLVSVIIMLAPPPGDAYNFILKYVTDSILNPLFILSQSLTQNVWSNIFLFSVISYPLAVVNVFVSLALLTLYIRPYSPHRAPQTWSPPFRATWPVVLFFLLSNIYLVVAPFIPPTDGQNIYENLPYYLHCVVGVGIFVVGALYWLAWAKFAPWLGGYSLERELIVGSDGWSGNVFRRVKKDT